MYNPPRDETKPRVSEIIKFLYEGDFDDIPRETLEIAIARGNKGHKLNEDHWNTDLDHPTVNMFRQGLEKVRAWVLANAPGSTIVIDYKFTRDTLRPVTAVQLVDYGELIAEVGELAPNRISIEAQLNGSRFTGKPDFVIQESFAHFEYFAFHYHQDGGLFVYRIPARAKEPLLDFALSLVKHHEDIKAGKLIKFTKLIEWERIQHEYDVFEIFYATMPPMTVTTELEAKTAIAMFRELSKVSDYEKHLKNEIMRYMEENDKTKLWDKSGGGVRLQTTNRRQFDSVKLKAFKETIITGTNPTTSLVRFNPPKKQKQIN